MKRNKYSKKSKYYDLNVCYPKYKTQLPSIIEGLEEHYSVIALTHTVYGKVRCGVDDSCYRNIPKSSMKIVKRLNIILEELSDLSFESKDLKVLYSYDLISFTPRTEAILTALVSSYSIPIDILVLPFPLRHTVIKNIIERDIGLELCYSPSLADPSKRKHWIKMAHECKQMCARMNPIPKFVLCSGMRWMNMKSEMSRDLGSMALRSPQDILNVCRVVWQWESKIIEDIMTKNPMTILNQAKKRHCNPNLESIMIEVKNPTDETNEEDGFLHF